MVVDKSKFEYMDILRLFCLIFFLLAGSGTSPASMLSKTEKQQLEDAVKKKLKDPDSASFKWDDPSEYYHNDDVIKSYCFEFNARNSFGGYVGFQQVLAMFEKSKYQLNNIRIVDLGGKTTAQSCVEIRNRMIRIKFHDPRVTDDQARAGCSILEGKLFCASPGTGMCWERGHNPWRGEAPARALDAEKHPEQCG